MKKVSPTPPTFEARLARLQEIVTALETGSLPLEQGLALYKEGMGLSQACRGQLEKARNEIRVLTAQGLEPFTPQQTDQGDDDA